jgi:hypothetical protein
MRLVFHFRSRSAVAQAAIDPRSSHPKVAQKVDKLQLAGFLSNHSRSALLWGLWTGESFRRIRATLCSERLSSEPLRQAGCRVFHGACFAEFLRVSTDVGRPRNGA